MRWTKINPSEAVRLYESGLSTREAGRKLGCSGTTIRDALVAAGKTLRPVGDVDGKGGWGAYRRKRRRA